ncbi:glycosyltransferase family 4 protein [Chitinophaga sp. G-6-1-13]|uniref:Glycosyltransferase family 4 protein n=1 Tax=Chitinophaga fulva TaxID=2728842 RepID=A0A848GGH2_9BACT|nr:hypothetical protein [Chitinophaga fulva]NML35830.1 glycosyltransferase family 4 protein [Chitinophaga fulva]
MTKNKRKIDIVEPLWTGEKHSSFNAAFLQTIGGLYKDCDITFYAEKKHAACVKEKLVTADNGGIPNISYLRTIYPDKKIKLPLLYLLSVLQSIRFLFKNSKSDLVFFTGISPFALVFLRILNFKRKQFLVVCHGELAFLDVATHQYLNMHYRILAKVFRCSFAFCLKSRYMFPIILGEHILQGVMEYVDAGLLRAKAITIEHPYIFSEETVTKDSEPVRKLRIATVGLATRVKKSHYIMELYSHLNEKGLLPQVELSIVGKVADFIEELERTDIRYYKATEFIPQEEYDRRISEQDYILFFYPDSTYRLTASGAFLDAILHNKPIIALRNQCFEHYISKVGSIGYITDDVAEMAEVVKRCVQNRTGEAARFDINIIRLKKMFGIESVSAELGKQLLDKGLLRYSR